MTRRPRTRGHATAGASRERPVAWARSRQLDGDESPWERGDESPHSRAGGRDAHPTAAVGQASLPASDGASMPRVIVPVVPHHRQRNRRHGCRPNRQAGSLPPTGARGPARDRPGRSGRGDSVTVGRARHSVRAAAEARDDGCDPRCAGDRRALPSLARRGGSAVLSRGLCGSFRRGNGRKANVSRPEAFFKRNWRLAISSARV